MPDEILSEIPRPNPYEELVPVDVESEIEFEIPVEEPTPLLQLEPTDDETPLLNPKLEPRLVLCPSLFP